MHVPRNLVPLLSDSLSLEPIGGPTQVRCKPLAQPVICPMCSLQLHALESARPARRHCHSWAQDAVPGRLQLSIVPAMQGVTCNAAEAFEMKGAESFCLFPDHDSDRKVSKCLGKAAHAAGCRNETNQSPAMVYGIQLPMIKQHKDENRERVRA